jgi:polysaccharide export outer membrane protein
LTLLDALAQAGGFSRAADKRRVTLKRVNRDGESESTVIDVIELMKGQAKNVWLLESGDVIAVPRSATSVGGAQAGDVL